MYQYIAKLLLHLVSDPRNRVDNFLGRLVTELFAKVEYMCLDGVGEWVSIHSPYMFEYGHAREDTTMVRHEVFE